MVNSTPRALIALEYPSLTRYIECELKRYGFHVDSCSSEADLFNRVLTTSYDAYIIEPGFRTPQPLAQVQRLRELIHERAPALFVNRDPNIVYECTQRGIQCIELINFSLDYIDNMLAPLLRQRRE